MTESSVEEMKILKRLRSRVNHLDKLFLIKNADSDEFNRWSKQRLDRLICDYLLRNGFYSTADALVEANNMQVGVLHEYTRPFSTVFVLYLGLGG